MASKQPIRGPRRKPGRRAAPARGAPRTNGERKRPAVGASSRSAAVKPPDAASAAGTFLVVGVGASAGGLEALGELTKNVPIDHMAFIVAQHLAPQHDSMLPQLLARMSRVKVVTAADGVTLEPNNVYV